MEIKLHIIYSQGVTNDVIEDNCLLTHRPAICSTAENLSLGTGLGRYSDFGECWMERRDFKAERNRNLC